MHFYSIEAITSTELKKCLLNKGENIWHCTKSYNSQFVFKWKQRPFRRLLILFHKFKWSWHL